MKYFLLFISFAAGVAGAPPIKPEVMGDALFVMHLRALEQNDPKLAPLGIHLDNPRLRVIVDLGDAPAIVVDALDIDKRPIFLLREIQYQQEAEREGSTVSMVTLRTLTEASPTKNGLRVLLDNIKWDKVSEGHPGLWPELPAPTYRIQVWDKRGSHIAIRSGLFPPFCNASIRSPERQLPEKIEFNQNELMLSYLCYVAISSVKSDYVFFNDCWRSSLDKDGALMIPKSPKDPFEKNTK